MDTSRSTGSSAPQRARTAKKSFAAAASVGLILASVAPGWSGGLPTAGFQNLIANEPVTFSVTGDVPYGSSEVALFQQQIDEHDLFSPSEFLVHVGDILAGSESCNESRYRDVRDILLSSEVPCYIVPGDNETSDCSNPSQGLQLWYQYLLGIDDNWACSPSTERQNGREENFAFVLKGILFLGIHLVGGSNDNAVLRDDADWVDAKFQQYDSQVRGAVIFAQSGPGTSASTFYDPFEVSATQFGKPILWMQGNGHSWKDDTPFNANNVRRIQVDNGGAELPVQITAGMNTSSPQTMFSYVRDPWDNNSQPVNRPPCDGSPTPTLAIDDVTLDEGNSGTVNAVFTVSLTNDDGSNITVDWNTSDGSATAGEDYQPSNGSVSFSGSGTTRTFSVPVFGDTDFEADENFFVDLSNASGASVTDGRGECTMRNDDVPVQYTLTVTTQGSGTVALSPSGGTYDEGTVVTLTPNPASGWFFDRWEGDLSGSADPETIAMDSNKSVTGVFGTNAFPVARTDSYRVDEDVTLNVAAPGVLENDTDSDLDPLTANLVSGPSNGSLNLSSNGSFAYVPDAHFNGSDSFTYEADDGRGGKDNATVNISVDPVNDAPVASNDGWTTDVSTTLTVNAPGVLANDSDIDGDALSATLLSGPSNGVLSLAADGSFVYDPTPGYNGPDSFTYEASDGNATSNATVDLTVGGPPIVVFNPTDDAQVRDSRANRNEGSSTTLRIKTASTSYRAYLKFQVTGFSSVKSATLRLYCTDSSPHGGNVHTVSNSYAGTGTPWDEGGLTWNNAPAMSGSPLADAGAVSSSSWIELDVTNAISGDGIYSFGIQSNSNNSVRYSSKEGAKAPELVMERGSGPGNTAPIALDDNATTDEDVQLSVVVPGVLQNDSDADGDPLSAALASPPANGSVTLNADGSYVYTPNANFNGLDGFSYIASDGAGGSDTGSVSIDVTPQNDAPTASADSWSVAKNNTLNVSAPGVLANDDDIDGDALSAVLATTTSNGVLTLNADGSFTYVPNSDYSGGDSFTYHSSDGSLQSAATQVDITITDAPTTITLAPIADARVRSTSPGKNYGTDDPLRAKTDATSYKSYLKFDVVNAGSVAQATLRMYCVDGSPLGGDIHLVSNHYAGTTTPWEELGITWDNAPTAPEPPIASHAAVSTDTWVEFDLTSAIPGDGTYSFCLQSTGTNSVRYNSREGTDPPELVLQTQGGGDPGNTPPVATGETYPVDEDQVLTVAAPGVLGNDGDDDGDALTASVVDAPSNGQLQLAADGSFSYTPNANFNGSDAFTYRASDGNGGSATAAVDINVAAVNDAPSGDADVYSVAMGAVLNVSAPGVLVNDGDVDGDALNALVEADVANGVLTLNADGSLTYTPDGAFDGTETFTYRVSDTNLQSDPITVTIHVGSAPPPASIAFEEVQGGGSEGSSQVATSGALAGGSGDLYLAAIACKSYREVANVSGLGLTWSRLRAQCAGRNQTGIELWMASGASSGGTISATFVSAPSTAVISVARYSGANASNPVGDIVSANTNGVSGVCSGGIDGPSYNVSLQVDGDGVVFAAAAMRSKSHTPGAGYTERSEVHHGSSGGSASSVALMDRDATPGTVVVDGQFSKDVDWAMIAVVIRSQGAATKAGATPALDPRLRVDVLPLYRVFPNPAVSSASIVYELAHSAPLSVTVYNARGQRVRTLARGVRPAGRGQLRWDARNETGVRVPAGVYFMRLQVGERVLTRKLVMRR
jgi:hypothetical protein